MKDGYGQFAVRRTVQLAHRVAWTISNGDIPLGLWVLHTCDIPNCVNPKHLYLGTALDNAEDRDSKFRRAPPSGSLNGNAAFTEAQVAAIRAEHGPINRIPGGGTATQGITCRQLAEKYGVALGTMKKIIYKQSWKHVS